ncbi:MAG: stage II sporulation protein P [Acutalibacteraceae bacterium]|nr:stage II sporulation protein P [Acutalibacteraceae bacterium]
MNTKKATFIRITAFVLFIATSAGLVTVFKEPFRHLCTEIVVLAAKSYLPVYSFLSEGDENITADTSAQDVSVSQAVTVSTTEESVTVQKVNKQVGLTDSLTVTDKDIKELIEKAKKTSADHIKDGDISEYKYVNDSVTDSFGRVKVKNTNKTGIDIEKKLKEKPDLSVSKEKPSVLIFHSHTTETYQLLDRGFYETGFMTRSNDNGRNMVRVGKAIAGQIEKAGFRVIHDTSVYDSKYSGAYSRSRKGAEEALKKYPSIQVVLDIHRDAIQRTDGTKIKPTAKINGKKAAQIMIISGCQEEGNGITNLPDWKYNLTFAVHLQDKLEELFEGITRPLYFCPRSYNMNLTHCSLLVEVGSDANTLEEAVYTGKCIGVAVSEILKKYEE